jgi:hypothetical protein
MSIQKRDNLSSFGIDKTSIYKKFVKNISFYIKWSRLVGRSYLFRILNGYKQDGRPFEKWRQFCPVFVCFWYSYPHCMLHIEGIWITSYWPSIQFMGNTIDFGHVQIRKNLSLRLSHSSRSTFLWIQLEHLNYLNTAILKPELIVFAFEMSLVTWSGWPFNNQTNLSGQGGIRNLTLGHVLTIGNSHWLVFRPPGPPPPQIRL